MNTCKYLEDNLETDLTGVCVFDSIFNLIIFCKNEGCTCFTHFLYFFRIQPSRSNIQLKVDSEETREILQIFPYLFSLTSSSKTLLPRLHPSKPSLDSIFFKILTSVSMQALYSLCSCSSRTPAIEAWVSSILS